MRKINSKKGIIEMFKEKEIEIVHHREPRSPHTLYINLDERCNENCVFCVVKGENMGKFGSMNKEEAKRIIKKFINVGGESIVFTGGEPTLREDLPEIIEYSEQFKALQGIWINTNGVRLSDKKYLNSLLKADFRKILSFSVSLHSHKKTISELLTRLPNSFEKTIKGIQNIIANNRKIIIYQVITTKNYKDLYKFGTFLYINFPQIKVINLAYPFPQGNALENDWIFPKISEVKPYLIKALKFFEDKNYKILIASCGQFPLCAIPGFEETVLSSLNLSEETVLGVVGKKVYHDFEMAGEEFQQFYKNKNKLCEKCLLNKVCQGFWKKYIDLFGFNGIQPITKDNFKGNKIKLSLRNDKQVQEIVTKMIKEKVNLIIVSNYLNDYLNKLIDLLRHNKIFVVIIYKNTILYPK